VQELLRCGPFSHERCTDWWQCQVPDSHETLESSFLFQLPNFNVKKSWVSAEMDGPFSFSCYFVIL
jgi:hypothetical protein